MGCRLSKGIFNPYATPSDTPQEPQNPIAEIPTAKPTIRMDGDSHIVVFKDATIEDMWNKLYAILKQIDLNDKNRMEQLGVCLRNPSEDVPQGYTSLPLGDTQLHIYVGKSLETKQLETAAFKRIGFMLKTINPVAILKKHNVTIITR